MQGLLGAVGATAIKVAAIAIPSVILLMIAVMTLQKLALNVSILTDVPPYPFCIFIAECSTGDLRLVNDITPDEIFNGRVELCIDGKYGGVCDSSWDNDDAAVVCKQWGDYTPSASVASVDSLFGQPGVSFVATDFQCDPDVHDALIDCPYTASTDCGQHDGAGTYCTLQCITGDMRLVNGSDSHGRVEICMDLLWHPICDSKWSNVDANVVCTQLGLSAIG